MAGLSGRDLDFAVFMRDVNVLEPVQGHLLDPSKGVILDFCGDGDHSFDIFMHTASMCEGQMGPRIHLISDNGGPARIVKDSPVNKPGRTTDEDVLDDIAGAVVLKNITKVALKGHALCGHNMMVGDLSFEDSCSLLVEAKRRVKTEVLPRVPGIVEILKRKFPEKDFGYVDEIQKLCVPLFMHVDWGMKKRTYHFNLPAWEAYQRGEVPLAKAPLDKKMPSWSEKFTQLFPDQYRIIPVPLDR